MHQRESSVTVVWYYEAEDEDMKESGEDFRDLVRMPVMMTPLRRRNSTGRVGRRCLGLLSRLLVKKWAAINRFRRS